MKLIVELSGEHPEIPFAELEILGRIIDRRKQVAVVETEDPEIAGRLALAHYVLEYLGECEARREELRDLLSRLDLSSDCSFAARVKKMHGTTMDASGSDLERLIGSMIRGEVSLEDPAQEFRAVISENRCYFGRVLHRFDRASFYHRRPGNRPFFHPGVMMPKTARALVNISLVRRGERMLDPFCGTGGIVLEAAMLGIGAVGSDIDPVMVQGSRKNLFEEDVLVADSTALPFQESSIDAVVTDLPYGQSSSLWAKSPESLYIESLHEIRRVLAPGRRAVLVTHRDITSLAGQVMKVEALYFQRVHKSLTRKILVLVKEPLPSAPAEVNIGDGSDTLYRQYEQ
ncbi:MAG TPA: methyltransferase domain-containing protein [Methanoregulaceae archaeon]|nr:methyltransferase domain-containing protein [Methanoregulaceae archaeon]